MAEDMFDKAIDVVERFQLLMKVYIYSPHIPGSSEDLTSITPKYWNSLFHSVILLSILTMQMIFYLISSLAFIKKKFIFPRF